MQKFVKYVKYVNDYISTPYYKCVKCKKVFDHRLDFVCTIDDEDTLKYYFPVCLKCCNKYQKLKEKNDG